MSERTPPGRSDDHTAPGDDQVARNRAAPLRSTPDRTPVGVGVTNQLRRITGAALLIATLVLVAVIVVDRVG